MTSSWFFLSTLNYDALSTTHQIHISVSYSKRRVSHVQRERKRERETDRETKFVTDTAVTWQGIAVCALAAVF